MGGVLKIKAPGSSKSQKNLGKLACDCVVVLKGRFLYKKSKFCEQNGPERILNLCLNRISGSLGFLIFALGAPDAPKTLQI